VDVKVFVHIERLVFNGFGAGDHSAIAAGLRRELERLFAEPSAADGLTRGREQQHLRLDSLRITPGTPPADIGKQTARGIGRRLAKSARSDSHG
jgi:hypothetical protein